MQLGKGTVIMEALVCVVIPAQTGIKCCCTTSRLGQCNLCIDNDDMAFHLLVKKGICRLQSIGDATRMLT